MRSGVGGEIEPPRPATLPLGKTEDTDATTAVAGGQIVANDGDGEAVPSQGRSVAAPAPERTRRPSGTACS